MTTNVTLAGTAIAIYLIGTAVLVATPARADIGDALRQYPVEVPPPVTCRIYGNAIYCG